MRPLMVFHSDLFDTHPTFQLVKSIFLDFYNHPLPELSLKGIEHVISLTAGPLTTFDTTTLPKLHLRVYTVKLLKSGSHVPRTELTEMGPSIDLTVRRVREANEDMMRAAMRRPKLEKKDVESGLGRKRKNIETDGMGDRVGRIHVGRQDLSKMQGRKMKGLKVARGENPKMDKE